MAFFTEEKLQRRPIEIERASVSSLSPEVQKRLQRINDNYQAFDEVFADVEATIERDEHLREFNASLRAADLQPKKKRWRSRDVRSTQKSGSGKRPKKTKRGAEVTKLKNAQVQIAKKNKRTAQTEHAAVGEIKKKKKKPR